jgi:hypothetical protein
MENKIEEKKAFRSFIDIYKECEMEEFPCETKLFQMVIAEVRRRLKEEPLAPGAEWWIRHFFEQQEYQNVQA